MEKFSILLILLLAVVQLQAKTHYEALELTPSANAERIKKQYRHLAKRYHPDKNDDPKAKAKFIEVSEAYEVLSDATKRREYDHNLKYGERGQMNNNMNNMKSRSNGRFHPDPFADFHRGHGQRNNNNNDENVFMFRTANGQYFFTSSSSFSSNSKRQSTMSWLELAMLLLPPIVIGLFPILACMACTMIVSKLVYGQEGNRNNTGQQQQQQQQQQQGHRQQAARQSSSTSTARSKPSKSTSDSLAPLHKLYSPDATMYLKKRGLISIIACSEQSLVILTQLMPSFSKDPVIGLDGTEGKKLKCLKDWRECDIVLVAVKQGGEKWMSFTQSKNVWGKAKQSFTNTRSSSNSNEDDENDGSGGGGDGDDNHGNNNGVARGIVENWLLSVIDGQCKWTSNTAKDPIPVLIFDQ